VLVLLSNVREDQMMQAHRSELKRDLVTRHVKACDAVNGLCQDQIISVQQIATHHLRHAG